MDKGAQKRQFGGSSKAGVVADYALIESRRHEILKENEVRSWLSGS